MIFIVRGNVVEGYNLVLIKHDPSSNIFEQKMIIK